jgi:hypothetical protein
VIGRLLELGKRGVGVLRVKGFGVWLKCKRPFLVMRWLGVLVSGFVKL